MKLVSRRMGLLVVAAFGALMVGTAGGGATNAAVRGSITSPSSPPDASTTVTLYGATWCSACRALEDGLKERQVPFEKIDVDQNPNAYAWAKKATGANVIPLTSISRKMSDVKWVIGSDVSAVEKAYKGE